MIIAYESKTGFTKKYAEMLAAKTNMKALPVRALSEAERGEDIIFMGWMKAGRIQGLKRALKYNVKAVCASGTARNAEPDAETVMARNKIEGLPFFYLRGGCLPLNEIKGMDKIMLKMFVKLLGSRKDKDAETQEAISIIQNGFDGVNEANLAPVLEWLNSK